MLDFNSADPCNMERQRCNDMIALWDAVKAIIGIHNLYNQLTLTVTQTFDSVRTILLSNARFYSVLDTSQYRLVFN